MTITQLKKFITKEHKRMVEKWDTDNDPGKRWKK